MIYVIIAGRRGLRKQGGILNVWGLNFVNKILCMYDKTVAKPMMIITSFTIFRSFIRSIAQLTIKSFYSPLSCFTRLSVRTRTGSLVIPSEAAPAPLHGHSGSSAGGTLPRGLLQARGGVLPTIPFHRREHQGSDNLRKLLEFITICVATGGWTLCMAPTRVLPGFSFHQVRSPYLQLRTFGDMRGASGMALQSAQHPSSHPHLLWPRAPVRLGRSGRSPRRSHLQRPPRPGVRPVRPVVCLLLGLPSSPAPGAGRLQRGSQDDKLMSPTAHGEAGCSLNEFGRRFPAGRASGRGRSSPGQRPEPPAPGPAPLAQGGEQCVRLEAAALG